MPSVHITDEAHEFLRDAYRRDVIEFFDDPDEQFTGWTHQEFGEWYQRMLLIGCGLGYHFEGSRFWDIARAEASEYERNRVKTMLTQARVTCRDPDDE